MQPSKAREYLLLSIFGLSESEGERVSASERENEREREHEGEHEGVSRVRED